MSGVRIYAERSSDGCSDYKVCDGTAHFQVFVIEGWSLEPEHRPEHLGECDGSCRPSDQKPRILATIERVRGKALQTGKIVKAKDGSVSTTGPRLTSRVIITPAAQAILDQDEIVATLDCDWYAKRSDEGESFRLPDGRRLSLCVSFDEWGCRNTGFYKTLEVDVRPPLFGENTDPTQHYVAGIEERAARILQAVASLQVA